MTHSSMNRIIRRICLVLSSIILLACLTAWIRGYFVADQLTWSHHPVIVGLAYGKGKIGVVKIRHLPWVEEGKEGFHVDCPRAGWHLEHHKPEGEDKWGPGPPEHEISFLGAKYQSGQVLFVYAQAL